MVGITTLRVLAIAMIGLIASSSVVAQDDDPSVEAAVYHAAGNSTKVQSDVVIIEPTASTVWYAQNSVSIRWTGTTPTNFAFQIINKDSTVRASGMTLVANVQTSAGIASSKIGQIEPGTYFVRLYLPTDTTKEVARSATFTVKAKSDKPTSSVSTITPMGNQNTSSDGTPSTTINNTPGQSNTTTGNTGSTASNSGTTKATTNAKNAALASFDMTSVKMAVTLLSLGVVALVL